MAPQRQKPNLPDRLPPHSEECEQAVLGCILLDPQNVLPQCIDAFKDGAETFYDLRHQTLYNTMIELQEDGVGIDVINLSERLKLWGMLEQVGGIAYISTLPDTTPTSINAGDYIRVVREKRVLRRMIQTCTEVVGKIYDNEGDVDELIDSCERDILQIGQSRVDAPNLSMNALVHQVIEDIERAHHNQGQPSGLTTGFADFDMMTGGLKPGQMIIVAGRPSTGKSSLALNIAEHVACDLGLGVGIISLEMTGVELAHRAVASRSRVGLRNMRDGFLAERDFPRITTASSTLVVAPIYIEDTGGLSIIQIRSKFRRWKQQYDIKVGILDYLQLANAIGSKRKFESRQQEVSEISVGIKTLAKELGIPIIALSQMNREFERDKKRKPRLADLRESGSLEQDSDIVGFLYHPSNGDDDDYSKEDAYPVNLLIAKNRNGPTGDVNLTFLRNITRFESAAKVGDEDVPQQQTQMPYNES